MEQDFLKLLDTWNEDDEHQRIVDEIGAVPEAERTYALTCRLARAYNNLGRFEEAAALLLSIWEEGENDPLWHYRLGYSYYYLDRDVEALKEFQCAKKLDPDDEDTEDYIEMCRAAIDYPTSVRPFRERVEAFWNAFSEQEAQLRAFLDNPDDPPQPQEALPLAETLLRIAFTEPFFEIGRLPGKDKYDLVLSADGLGHRLFKLEYWKRHAPQSLLSTWNFLVGRQPCADLSQIELRMYGVSLCASDVQIWAEALEAERKIGLRAYCPKLLPLLETDAGKARALIYILMDQCIGETEVIGRMAYLELLTEPLAASDAMTLEGLRTYWEARPTLWKGGPETLSTPYRFQPVDGESWLMREDVLFGDTCCPRLINSYYNDESSIMDEHHKDGVIFGFLYFSHDGLEGNQFIPLRAKLAEEVAERAGECGEVIGGATGRAYSYIDCICYDLRAFLSVSSEILRSRQMSEYGFQVFRRQSPSIDLGETVYGDMEAPEQYDEEELEVVEAHIQSCFGEYDEILHELSSPDIHVDICPIPPSPGHAYYTLVTMGMGAHQMNLPEELQEKGIDRAELLICLPPDWDIRSSSENWYWPIRCLKMLARLPGQEDSWLGWGHTIDNGSPFAANTSLCGSILTDPWDFGEDAHLCHLPNGEVIRFYQVIPLYAEEIAFKRAYNAEALLDYMDDDMLEVVNPARENACAGLMPASDEPS